MNPENYLYLATILFVIGAIGVLVRRNAIVVFMSIELMLNASNLAFVSFARLNGNPDFERIKTYLFDQADPYITRILKLSKEPILVCWNQGAAQTLDDIRDISVNAADWLGKELLKHQQKEGTGNV